MTEDQFDALVSLMQDIAYRAAGDAVHQQRAGSANHAENYARVMFDLPQKEDHEG